MADHVHQEMTRNRILVFLRLVLLIVIKDVFLSLVSFLNKSNNLMDRTLHEIHSCITYNFLVRRQSGLYLTFFPIFLEISK